MLTQHLSVSPVQSFADEAVHIKVSGMSSHQSITLRLISAVGPRTDQRKRAGRNNLLPQ